MLATKPRTWPNSGMTVMRDREAADRRRKGLALKALRCLLYTSDAADE